MRDFTGPTNPRKQKQKTLPMVENQSGTVSATPFEADQIWIDFFAEMEGGNRQTMQDLHHDWVCALQSEPQEAFDLHTSQRRPLQISNLLSEGLQRAKPLGLITFPESFVTWLQSIVPG
jgi:hypothetical protein